MFSTPARVAAACVAVALAAGAEAAVPTLTDCLEGSDFVANAARSRDNGMSRASFLERLDGAPDRAVGRHDHHRHFGIPLADAVEQLVAVHPGHSQVRQKDVRGLLGHLPEGLLPVRGEKYFVPVFGQDLSQAPAGRLLVVRDQNPSSGLGHGLRLAGIPGP